MCYTNGPRCDTKGTTNLVSAQEAFRVDPSEENKQLVDKAELEFKTTPAGIKKLRDAGNDAEADLYQNKRDLMIAKSVEESHAKALGNPDGNPNLLHQSVVSGYRQAQVAAANNPNISMRTLDYIVKNRETDDFRLAVARNINATEEHLDWAADNQPNYVQNVALDNINVSQDTVKKIASDAGKRYKAGKKEQEDNSYTIPQGAHESLTRSAGSTWKKARTLLEVPSRERSEKHYEAADNAIPRDGTYKDYYASTDAKHFSDKNKPGSKFTDPRVKDLNSVAALASYQRGSLDGDDRDALVKFGANPAALNPNFRYLIVKTPGKLGAQDISTFPPNTKFRVERTKEGGSCSVVADVKSQKTVNFGVVIMGRPPGVDKDCVITAHPGMPSRSSGKDTFGAYEGRTLLASQLFEITGTDKVNINTRVV